MTDDNITRLFAGDGPQESSSVAQVDPARTFEIHMTDGTVVTESGFLGLGPYVAVLAGPNDSLNIKFAAEAGKVNYVQQTDEVIDED